MLPIQKYRPMSTPTSTSDGVPTQRTLIPAHTHMHILLRCRCVLPSCRAITFRAHGSQDTSFARSFLTAKAFIFFVTACPHTRAHAPNGTKRLTHKCNTHRNTTCDGHSTCLVEGQLRVRLSGQEDGRHRRLGTDGAQRCLQNKGQRGNAAELGEGGGGRGGARSRRR